MEPSSPGYPDLPPSYPMSPSPHPLQTLSVTYALQAEDYEDFSLYHSRHSATSRRNRWVVYWLPPVGWFLLLPAIASPDRRAGALLPAAVISLLWLAVAPTYWRWYLRRHVRKMLSEGKNASLGTENTLTISPEGLCSTSDDGESKLKWKAVERVAVGERHAYLYLSAVSAVIIPKAAFTSLEEFDRFIEGVRLFREAAVGLTSSGGKRHLT